MFTYSDYYKQCESVAKDIINDLKEDDSLDWFDLLSEHVDQHEYIIYYAKAFKVLEHSSNWTAIDDMGLEPANNIADQIQQAAYYAMHADIDSYLQTMLEEEGLNQ